MTKNVHSVHFESKEAQKLLVFGDWKKKLDAHFDIENYAYFQRQFLILFLLADYIVLPKYSRTMCARTVTTLSKISNILYLVLSI